MANTHRAVIETSVPPGMEIVGAGSQEFCEAALAAWVRDHPLGEYETPLILEVITTATLPTEYSLVEGSFADVLVREARRAAAEGI